MSLIVLINGVDDYGEPKNAGNSRRLELFSTLFPSADVHAFSFLAEDVDALSSSYIWERARNIIDTLQKSIVSPSSQKEPAAVVFLANTTGATLVKQILLRALENPLYQWLAFGVSGLHFFESPCFIHPRLWDDFLIQTLAIGGIQNLRPSQLFSTLPDALAQVEREFAMVSQGFNITPHDEPKPQNSRDKWSPLWEFNENDPRLDEVLCSISRELRRKPIGQQRGFQTLQQYLSLRATSLSRIKPLTTDTESTAWIFSHPSYEEWMISTDSAVLEIIGAPDSGSGHICSHIISTFKTNNEDPQPFVMTFNFTRQASRRNSDRALITSLIRQLLTLDPQLYRMVQNITDLLVLQSNVAYGQLLDLLRFLLSKVEVSKNTFLVINDVDQCMQPLQSTIASLVKISFLSGCLKILMTASTPSELPSSVSYFRIFLSESDAVDRIRNSIDQRVAQIMIQKPAWKDSQEAIIQKLSAEGCTFLQAALNLGILEGGHTPSTRNGIRNFLSDEPIQPKGALETIANAQKNHEEPARLFLNWIFHAVRPLTVSELAVVLALTPDKEVEGTSKLNMIHNELSLTMVRDLISSMNTIIKLVDDEVMPIHHTLYDCFQTSKTLLIPDFHSFATRCCLTYILASSSHAMITANSGGDQVSAQLSIATEFLDYAETSWPEHYRLGPMPTPSLDEEVFQFLTSCPWWVRRYAGVFQWRIDFDLDDVLLLATHLEFPRIVQYLVDNEDISSPERIIASLAISARTGNAEIFQDLAERVPVDSDLTAVLCNAAEYGSSNIIQLLIGADGAPSFQSMSDIQEKGDPVLLAAQHAHAETVRILLSDGRQIFSVEETAQGGESAPVFQTSSLHVAAQLGDVDTCLALQSLSPNEFEALIDTPNSDGKSPLMLSCISGSAQEFDILFKASKRKGDRELHELLSIAARHGHLGLVDQLLSSGAPISEGTGYAPGPLEAAALNGHYAVFNRLIDEGHKLFNFAELWNFRLSANFDSYFTDCTDYDYRIVAALVPHRRATNGTDHHAMLWAVFGGQLDTIKVLMDAGISVHQPGDQSKYNSLLDAAVTGNRPESIRFLMDQGVCVQWDESMEETSIHYATRLDRALCVRELLQTATPKDVRRKNGLQKTAFEVAVETGGATVVKALLDWEYRDLSFNPSQAFQKPASILISALRSGNLDLVRLLLDNGWAANNVESRSQDLPLHIAIEVGNQSIIKLLLERSTSPNAKNTKGEMSLHAAVRFKSEPAIRILLEHNADTNIFNSEGLSPLHLAVTEEETNLVAALLGPSKDKDGEVRQARNKADIDEAGDGNEESQTPHPGVDVATQNSGSTPLLIAIEKCNPSIVHVLLKAGANPNGQAGAFGSLLNTAIWTGEFEIIKALLDGGASTTAIAPAFGGPFHTLDYCGVSAPKKRERQEIRAIANLLLEYGAEIDGADVVGFTPLMRAIINYSIPYAIELLDLGADPSILDNAGMTCIHYAASWGSVSLIKKLIGAGLDLLTPDAWSRRPLYRAALTVKRDADYSQPENSLHRFDTLLNALPADDKISHLESAVTAALKSGSTRLFQDIMDYEDLDPNVPDRHGWTALDIADSFPSLAEEASILRRKGAVHGGVIEEATRLGPCDLHYDLFLSPDGTEAWIEGTIHKSPLMFRGCVRADHCIPRNSDSYFEVEILDLQPGNIISIGLVQESLDFISLIGWERGTWGYHSDDGSIISENEIVVQGAPSYQAGDTVGVSVNMSSRKACFILGSHWKSAAFDIYGQVYPAVSFNWYSGGISKVKINFGPEQGGAEFRYKTRGDWEEIAAAQ